LFLARGPWPRKELIRLAPGFDFPYGESISSDQHPPRGGGDCPLALGLDGQVVTRVGKHGSSLLVEVRADEVKELTRTGQGGLAVPARAGGGPWAPTVGAPRLSRRPGALRARVTAQRADRPAQSLARRDRARRGRGALVPVVRRHADPGVAREAGACRRRQR